MRLNETSEKSINNIDKQMKQSKGSIKENKIGKENPQNTILDEALSSRKVKKEWKHLSSSEKDVILNEMKKDHHSNTPSEELEGVHSLINAKTKKVGRGLRGNVIIRSNKKINGKEQYEQLYFETDQNIKTKKQGSNLKKEQLLNKHTTTQATTNSIVASKGNGISKKVIAFSFLKKLFKQSQTKKLEQKEQQGISASNLMSGAYGSAKIVKGSMSLLSAFVQATFSILSAILPFVIPIIIIFCLLILIIGGATESRPAGYGLPSFITDDMMEAFFEEQQMYGIPVSSGVAQVIQESGFGSYGPGGESGNGLSKLAYEDKNLFGIKYWSGDKYAIGQNSWITQEQNGNGMTTITAGFSKYPDYTACIKQRTVMLKGSRYWQHLAPYQNQNDGSYSVEYARKFVEGIKAGGWATSNVYVESLTKQMDTYDLYRFDNMTFEQFQSSKSEAHGEDYQNASNMQKQIVDAAYSTGFVGDGLCATWVSKVFNNAGLGYPTGNGNSFNMVTSPGEIKVGMVICVQHSPYGSNGYTYGHIGIYIGDGKVMHNESSRTGNCSNGCTITDLDQWRATYEYQCTAYWGWVFGKDLSTM